MSRYPSRDKSRATKSRLTKPVAGALAPECHHPPSRDKSRATKFRMTTSVAGALAPVCHDTLHGINPVLQLNKLFIA